MKRKRLAAAGVAVAGLAGGAVAGAALTAPGIVGAQDDTTTSTVVDPEADGRPKMEDRLRETLAPLVEDGTIDQAQLDAVVQRLGDAAPPRGRGHGPGGMHRGAGHVALDAAADALGVTEDELRTALRDGQSISEVAEANGVDTQTVIDALVAEATARIDDGVANGRIDEAEAAEKKAELPERITSMVERSRGDGAPRTEDAPSGEGSGWQDVD